MKKTFIMLAIPLAISGCSSIKYNTGVEFKAPSFGSAEGREVNYPDWFAKTDKESDKLTSVATEFSKDFQFSVDKAMLSAKRDLAGHYSSYVSAMMKDFASEVGDDGSVVKDIDRTTKLVVAQVNLVGVKRDNFEVRHENGGYRAFVKLSYDTSTANKVLVEKIRNDRKLNAKLNKSQSFKELEASVNKLTENESVVVTPIEPTNSVAIQ